MSKSSKKLPSTAFAIIALLFTGGMVAVFDGMLIRQFLQERAARGGWSEVTATVLESRVLAESSGDGTSYKPLVRYAYEFEGMALEGDRYAFGADMHFGSSFARSVVAAHPEGKRVTAWVDPEDPGSAVLSVDGSAMPGFILVFLTPFNCIPLAILTYLILGRRKRGISHVQTRYVVVDTPNDLVVSKVPAHPVIAFIGLTGLFAFLSVFILGFAVGFPRADEIALPTLGGIMVLALVWTVVGTWRAKRPSRFLHVDLDRWSFAYPADGERVTLPTTPELQVVSEPTNTTVNDERIHDNRIMLDRGEEEEALLMFRFRGSESDGAELLDLISERLAPGGR